MNNGLVTSNDMLLATMLAINIVFSVVYASKVVVYLAGHARQRHGFVLALSGWVLCAINTATLAHFYRVN